MHDDDEERFPRISLGEFIRGMFGPILEFCLYGPAAFFMSDKGDDREGKERHPGAARRSDVT